MTDVLTVGALGALLLARWRMITAFVVVGLCAGIAYGMWAPSSYTAKAVLFVIAPPADKDGYYQGAQFAEKRAATYPALISAPQVVDRTIARLDLDMTSSALVPLLTATNPTDSPLVEVSATGSTPTQAQQLAGTAAEYLAAYAIQLEASGTQAGAVTVKLAVPAREPQSPSSPSTSVYGALGALGGGTLGVVAALSLYALRRRPRTKGGAPSTGTTGVDPAGVSHAGEAVTSPDRGSAGRPSTTDSPSARQPAAFRAQAAPTSGAAGSVSPDPARTTDDGRPAHAAVPTTTADQPSRRRRWAYHPAGPAAVVRGAGVGGGSMSGSSTGDGS